MHWIILANGPCVWTPALIETILHADCRVGVDGGCRHLEQLRLLPDIAIGDMDSIGPSLLQHYIHKQVEIHRHPAKKDATDLELALETAKSRGATQVTLLGATGGRLDHCLGNIFLLAKCLDSDLPACIMDERHTLRLTANSLDVFGRVGDTLSILPVTAEVRGVTLRGLEYPLCEATLRFGSSRGLSNVFVAPKATVSLRSGRLLVTHVHEPDITTEPAGPTSRHTD